MISRVARQLGVGNESLRTLGQAGRGGCRQASGPHQRGAGRAKRLRKENFELRRANDILQSAATFFGAELDRRGKK